jgi:hypothetical protein
VGGIVGVSVACLVIVAAVLILGLYRARKLHRLPFIVQYDSFHNDEQHWQDDYDVPMTNTMDCPY